MKTAAWFIDESRDVLQAYSEHYRPAIEELIQRRDLDGTDLWLAQVAWARRPAPVEPEHLRDRVPYMSVPEAERRLRYAAEHGVLALDGAGYILTEVGQLVVDEIVTLLYETARSVGNGIPDGAADLLGLLEPTVEACESCASFDTPNLKASRCFDPGGEAPMLERMRRYMNDLLAFRDDAHIAAWRVYGICGYEWEVFSHVWGDNVWGDQVSTPAEAAAKLGFRGYTEAEYLRAMDRLVARGWLSVMDDMYAPSAAGAKLRAAAEETTDRMFFGPWRLADEELDDLRAHLESLRRYLEEPRQ